MRESAATPPEHSIPEAAAKPGGETAHDSWHVSENEIVDKPWGREELFAGDREPYVGKIITLRDGNAVSLQLHTEKSETLTMLSGRLNVEVGDAQDALDAFTLEPGAALFIPAGVIHRFTAVGDAVFVEVSTAAPGRRTDVTRLEDRFGRSGTTAQ